jgi:hypothetical protein
MKKAFKETKFGKLLNEKLPDAIAVVGDVLPDKGVLGIVKNIIDSSTLTIDEKEELKAQMLEFEKLEFEDRKDARQVQIEALRQDDLFSKRFNYYLAGGSIFLGFIYLFAVTFIVIDKESQRFADIGFGVVSTVVFGQIYSFFFGSSQSSHKKSETIENLRK